MSLFQGLFNTAYLGVLSQGQPSALANGHCLYRGPNGTKCAIGWLIEDELAEELDKKIGNLSILSHEKITSPRPSFLNKKNISFLSELQNIHDNTARETLEAPKLFLDLFKRNARNFAKKWGLVVPEPRNHTHTQ